MFVHYYDLRSEDKLPQTAYFLDPIDSEKYYPQASESFQQFTSRIINSREQKNLEAIPQESMEVLIKVSLSETANHLDLEQFFVRRALNHSLAQFTSLAKTIISQRVHGKQVDFNTRQSRATSCSTCPLHQSKSSVAWAASAIINKAASLEVIHESPLEKKLGTCRACGCGLKSKVRFDLIHMLMPMTPSNLSEILKVYKEQAYDKCWILREAITTQSFRAVVENKLKYLPPEYSSTLEAYLASSIQKAKNGNK